MQLKKYLGLFILAIALLSFGNKPNTAPNQELIIALDANQISTSNTTSISKIVIAKLKALGAKTIAVSINGSQLKVSYYINKNINTLKLAFSKDNDLDIAFTSNTKNSKELPEENQKPSLNINIYELVSIDSNIKLQGVFNTTDISFDLAKIPLCTNLVSVLNYNTLFNLKLKLQAYKTIALSNTFSTIPEVRAGPIQS